MKYIYILVLGLVFTYPSQGQIFKIDFFDAERQSQVDSFLIKYPDVRYITQKLTIRKNVTNLHGLKNVREIANFDILDNSIMNNFLGLEKLEKCGYISLGKNQNNIIDFSGLENLKTIYLIGCKGSLTLQSLKGLDGLTKIEGAISISNCPRLKSIAALNNVDTILNRNYSVPGDLQYYGEIFIDNCDSLETLDGLQNVSAITYLRIQNNERLRDISAIENITFLKYPDRQCLYLKHNKNLSICNYQNICDFIQTVDRKVVLQVGQNKVYNIEINDNAEGCKDYQTLLDVCLVPTEEHHLLHEVEIFPNPGTHFLEIKLNADLELNVDIFDSQGKVVARAQSNYIDTEHLPQGFYFVRIKHKESNATTTKKWIKI